MENYNKSHALNWLTESIQFQLKEAGFTPNAKYDCYTRTIENSVHKLIISFNSYQGVSYHPNFTFKITDKNFETSYKRFTERFDVGMYPYEKVGTIYSNCQLRERSGNGFNRHYYGYGGIENEDNAKKIAQKLILFFNKYINEQSIQMVEFGNCDKYTHMDDYWRIDKDPPVEHVFWWPAQLKNKSVYLKLLYWYHTYNKPEFEKFAYRIFKDSHSGVWNAPMEILEDFKKII